jgi:hypothetical protein
MYRMASARSNRRGLKLVAAATVIAAGVAAVVLLLSPAAKTVTTGADDGCRITAGGRIVVGATTTAGSVERSTRSFPTAAAVHRAIAYLRTRDCEGALAVVDTQGRQYGYRARTTYTSASVVKAMLLVQYLRTHDEIDDDMRSTLRLMITESNNDAAYKTYAIVGAGGLRALVDRVGMRDFSPGDNVLYSRITAADQARFFARLDDYLSRAWRSYAHRLFTHIVSSQTWGIAEVARPRWTVLFKSGWFGSVEDPYTLVNQVARLQRGSEVWSVAVLTDGNPHSPYAFATLRGVTRRLLGDTH